MTDNKSADFSACFMTNHYKNILVIRTLKIRRSDFRTILVQRID